MKYFINSSIFVFFMVFAMGAAGVVAADSSNFAEVEPGDGVVVFTTGLEYKTLTLTVAGPGNAVYRQIFNYKDEVYYKLVDECGEPLPDGVFQYQLLLRPDLDPKTREILQEASKNDELRNSCIARYVLPRYLAENAPAMVQSGAFTLMDGKIVLGDVPAQVNEPDADGIPRGPALEDILHYDDVIITGSLCVGFDCQDGESFGFDTVILKEHNLRIYFNDTSYTASYPTNNWRITINDSTNGGASYFSVDDVDDGTSIFKIEAGAPSNSLYVEDYGRVGLGTSTPVVELHIKDSDTPTLRLEQDGSGGWTPQTFDVAGNESNFFIRDATNGSKLPFRIQPSTPSSTLCMKSSGYVGIGTWSPAYKLEVETTGEDAILFLERTSHVQTYITAGETTGYFGTANDYPLRLMTSGGWRMELNTDNSLEMRSGATCDSTGHWHDSSSRELKENIAALDPGDALNALKELEPMTFTYKSDASKEKWVGFIAEDVPDLVATKSRKTLVAMDIVAVLTRVVQEQQTRVEQQRKTISDLTERLVEMEKKLQ
ncbi:MAG: tail fiber domain-containing protein [Desulfobacterales bacterium]|nr:tail fiber domain-containing protein [Desulfobacterales bacterium]